MKRARKGTEPTDCVVNDVKFLQEVLEIGSKVLGIEGEKQPSLSVMEVR